QSVNGQVPVVTYRLVRDDFEVSCARNCRKMTALDHLIAASDLTPAALHEEISAAFRMWQVPASISLCQPPADACANILMGAQAEPEGWAVADVFYDTASPEPVKPISQARVWLNPAKRWKIGLDGDLKAYDLRYTLAHEIGHAIGLDHPAGSGQMMG